MMSSMSGQVVLQDKYPSDKSTHLRSIIERFTPDLRPFEELYRQIHRNAELSCQEKDTANTVSTQLQHLNFKVLEGIGGYGVVGILENGPGKTVMLRAELDALPIEEKADLPFASTRRMEDSWGREEPVMHACGHDMHITCLLAACKLLYSSKEEWSGTLLALFQPNEEQVGGAQAMVEDGLYSKIQKPDVIFAQHGMEIESGMLSVKAGPVLVSADTIKVRLFASLGHHANPQIAADPVRTAAVIITQLDKMLSDVSNGVHAAIRIDQIHAGRPGADWIDHVDLVLDIKTFDQDLRIRLHESLKGLIVRESQASGAKQDPQITIKERAQLTRNDDTVARKLRGVFAGYFGPTKLSEQLPAHPVEDFSKLATAIDVPYVFWWMGRVDPAELDKAEKNNRLLDWIPIEHSPHNAPVIQPTMKTGMDALSLAALYFFNESKPFEAAK